MLAFSFDGTRTRLADRPAAPRGPGEVRIRPRLSGVCATDLEIARGYMGFEGVLGHEFVGDVTEADAPEWVGRRVVGGINASCGECPACLAGRASHCPSRTVLGILGRDGVLAESFVLPEANLVPVPDAVPDEQAVFAEPLAAACRILEQVEVARGDRVAVVGDGRLGLLCAWVLGDRAGRVVLVGRHPGRVALGPTVDEPAPDDVPDSSFDLVVDATGAPEGLSRALALVRPGGVVVLKTTCAAPHRLSLAPVVIDEVTVVGSRCGPIAKAVELLAAGRVPVERLIADRRPFARVPEAFARAGEGGVLKVLVEGPA